MFADDPKAKDSHIRKDVFLAAMNRLFAAGTWPERSGLRHTARSWRDAIEALSDPKMETTQ